VQAPPADADRVRMQAAAAASYDRVALDRMLIEQLPQIVKEAAAGLAGANVSVLNGADGLSEVAAGLVAQGLTILDSVKKGLVADQPIPRSELPVPVDGNSPDQASA
jgi:flotillin